MSSTLTLCCMISYCYVSMVFMSGNKSYVQDSTGKAQFASQFDAQKYSNRLQQRESGELPPNIELMTAKQINDVTQKGCITSGILEFDPIPIYHHQQNVHVSEHCDDQSFQSDLSDSSEDICYQNLAPLPSLSPRSIAATIPIDDAAILRRQMRIKKQYKEDQEIKIQHHLYRLKDPKYFKSKVFQIQRVEDDKRYDIELRQNEAKKKYTFPPLNEIRSRINIEKEEKCDLLRLYYPTQRNLSSKDVTAKQVWFTREKIIKAQNERKRLNRKRVQSEIFKLLPMYEGFMEKEGQVIHSWKTRYFVLDRNGVLSYYKDRNKTPVIRQIDIKAEVIKLERCAFGERKFGILLTTKDRAFKFSCKDNYEANVWVESIKVFAKGVLVNIGDAWIDDVVFTPIKCGWMVKAGQYGGKWCMRYFKLNPDGTLTYYETTNSQPKGIINLRKTGTKIEAALFEEYSNGFGIKLETKDRTWKFVCDYPLQREEWIRDIARFIQL